MLQRWPHHLMIGVILLCTPAAAAENWPQFRGPRRDNLSAETGLPRKWSASGPKVVWTTPVCQGYASAAIHHGRVYFNDYDEAAKEWMVRCLNLDDGKELWRFTEKKRIRPNHGITRSVPAVDGKFVIVLNPKCGLRCLKAESGEIVWQKSLVKEYGTKIPPWYNGQCPLIEDDRVIIAPGGEAMMVALDKATGSELWRTPDPGGEMMSHASVMPANLGGVQQYLWCTLKGLYGVSADDGRVLWFHPRKFNVAVAPSPLPIGDDRVFMTSGYEAGTIMIRVNKEDDEFKTAVVFDWTDNEWNSEVHTPVIVDDHLFAVGRKKRGLFTCLDFEGNTEWTSAGKAAFGLGSFLYADGMFFILEGKTGMLRLLEANSAEYRELASVQVVSGHDVWGPMAMSDGRLVLRDMKKMVCVDLRAASN